MKRNNRLSLTESQLHRVIKESVKRVLKEDNSYKTLKTEYAKYMAAADRLTQENRIDLAMQSMEKAYSILSQIHQHSKYDGTDFTSRTTFNNDETLQNGVKIGRGPEMFGKGMEFGR